jgi:hypothetical protein
MWEGQVSTARNLYSIHQSLWNAKQPATAISAGRRSAAVNHEDGFQYGVLMTFFTIVPGSLNE